MFLNRVRYLGIDRLRACLIAMLVSVLTFRTYKIVSVRRKGRVSVGLKLIAKEFASWLTFLANGL